MSREVRSLVQPSRVVVMAEGTAGEQLGGVLERAGYVVCRLPVTAPHGVRRVDQLAPALVVARVTARELVAAREVCRALAASRPLVLVTPTGTREAIEMARETGALVHLVEPLTPAALVAAAKVAAARWEDGQRLRREWLAAREAVHVREVVERAKSVLMRRLGLSEEEAHRRLQLESRSRNRRLIETAWHVLHAEQALCRQLGSCSGPPRES